MHYRLPEGLSQHNDRFIARLARFGAAVARFIVVGGSSGAGARPALRPHPRS